MEAESTIQEIIKEDFNRIYFKARKFYVGTEAYTQNGNRADVLFGFKRKNQIYIAAIEVKTRKTLKNLKPQTDPERKVKWARILAIVLFLSVFLYFQIETHLDSLILALVLISFITVAIIIGHFLEKKALGFILSIPAIDQLKKYPAHEKWIGITSDTFVKEEDYRTLLKNCKKERIGLMIVQQNGFIKVKLKPVPANEGNRYIGNYLDKDIIINHLQNASKRYRTPSEKAKSLRYITSTITGIIAFVFVTSLMNQQPSFKHKGNSLSFAHTEKKPVDQERLKPSTDQPNKQDDEFIEKGIPVLETDDQPCYYFDIDTTQILLLVDISKSHSEANKKVAELNSERIGKFAFVHSTCINTWIKKDRYIIHTNALYTDWKQVEQLGLKLKKDLEKNGIKCKRCEPITLEKNN